MPSKPIAIPANNTLLSPKPTSLLSPKIGSTRDTGIPDREVDKSANSSDRPAMDTPECRLAVKNERIVKQTLLKRSPLTSSKAN